MTQHDGDFVIGGIHVPRFHGQLKQDRLVLEILDFKQGGYFVEVGAWHPTNISNTFILETKFNWSGLCIDPFPVRGFAEKRPGSRLIETAVGRVDGEVLDFRMAEWAGGFEKCLSDRAFNRPIVKNAEVVSVSTKSLESILIQNNSPREIDFLSLDTEGSEFEIIRDFDFEKYSFKVIINEHNFIQENRVSVRNLLLSRGYFLYCELEHDDVYVNKSQRSKND